MKVTRRRVDCWRKSHNSLFPPFHPSSFLLHQYSSREVKLQIGTPTNYLENEFETAVRGELSAPPLSSFHDFLPFERAMIALPSALQAIALANKSQGLHTLHTRAQEREKGAIHLGEGRVLQ